MLLELAIEGTRKYLEENPDASVADIVELVEFRSNLGALHRSSMRVHSGDMSAVRSQRGSECDASTSTTDVEHLIFVPDSHGVDECPRTKIQLTVIEDSGATDRFDQMRAVTKGELAREVALLSEISLSLRGKHRSLTHLDLRHFGEQLLHFFVQPHVFRFFVANELSPGNTEGGHWPD